MPDTRKLSLRILYTINSSPQYILARSHSLVPAVLVLQAQDSFNKSDAILSSATKYEPQYATTSLKACLDTICCSSPELVQDTTRDFSIYVLDPLESHSAPAPVNISHSNSGSRTQITITQNPHAEQSRGVAVGLGLMSWALLADENDSVAVAGTLIKLSTSQEALEVIFALRETATIQKTSLPVRSWGPPMSKSRGRIKYPSLASNFASDTHINFGTCTSAQATPLLSPSAVASSSTLEPSGSTSMSTLAALASIHMRSKSKQPKAVKPVAAPTTESDKLMDTGDIYIGPLKKKGRPKGVGTNHELLGESGNTGTPSITDETDINDKCIISDADDISITSSKQDAKSGAQGFVSMSSAISKKRKPRNVRDHQPRETTIPPFSSTPLIRQPQVENSVTCLAKPAEPTSLLDILTFLSTSSLSHEPNIQNAALLAALSAIDSTPNPANPSEVPTRESNPALINALKQLLSACANQAPPAVPATAATHSHPHTSSHAQTPSSPSQDDDIVLLDKENVDPSAFRRRSSREDAKLQDTASPTLPSRLGLSPSEAGHAAALIRHERPPQSLSLSARVNENSSPAVGSMLARSNPSAPSGIRRKRTLSDFLDERDSARTQAKARQREWAERRDARRYVHSARRNSSSGTGTDRMKHYPGLITSHGSSHERSSTNSYYRTGTEPCTSPPRPKKEGHGLTHDDNNDRIENLRGRSANISDSPRVQRVSASSPVRTITTQSQPRKRYVVPEWARTNTATQPRLSEEAKQALEEKKREERTPGNKHKQKNNAREREKGVKEKGNTIQNNHSTTPSVPLVVPGPIAASSDSPVFAMTSSTPLSPSQSTPEPTPSTSSHPWSVDIRQLPSTPPRRRREDNHSPERDDGSLFTPTPKSWGGGTLAIAQSPLFSPQVRSQSRASLFGRAEKAKLSPIQAAVLGQDISTMAWGGASRKDSEEDNENLEDALGQELNSAFEELHAPPSSLPVASSDPAVDDISSTCGDPESKSRPSYDDWDEIRHYPLKEHWSGLPPSSPPPPISPLLGPQDTELEVRSDDEDMDGSELPIATSDAEEYLFEPEFIGLASVQNVPVFENDELAEFLASNDFGSLFPRINNQPVLGEDTTSLDMDIFDQFTNLNAGLDGSHAGKQQNIDLEVDSVLQNGVADFDFAEFWETFKPLVENHTDSDGQIGVDSAQTKDSRLLGMTGDLDHVKLAEDVQALFSGCLV